MKSNIKNYMKEVFGDAIKKIKEYGLCSILLFLIKIGAVILGGRRGSEITNAIWGEREKKEEEKKEERDIGKEKIDVLWEKQWKKGTETENWFLEFFKGVYRETKQKCKKNRAKNFAFKFVYIIILLISFMGFLLYCLWNIKYSDNNIFSIIENGVFFVILVFALSIVSKWLDIKQYQETWARHYHHKYLLEKEMMLYVNKFDSYAGIDEEKKRQEFIKNIIKIEDINEKKFVTNIEQNEEPLGNMEGLLKK